MANTWRLRYDRGNSWAGRESPTWGGEESGQDRVRLSEGRISGLAVDMSLAAMKAGGTEVRANQGRRQNGAYRTGRKRASSPNRYPRRLLGANPYRKTLSHDINE